MKKLAEKVDFPKVGKTLIALMGFGECVLYCYLLAAHEGTQATLLSMVLILAALLSLLHAVASIPIKLYFNWPYIYRAVGVGAIAARVLGIILIVKLNESPSEQFYLTEDGLLGLQQMAIIFGALSALLLYEKAHYHLTKQEAKNMAKHKLIAT